MISTFTIKRTDLIVAPCRPRAQIAISSASSTRAVFVLVSARQPMIRRVGGVLVADGGLAGFSAHDTA
jgi:hypothetical protein